jgi:hypothetical protein
MAAAATAAPAAGTTCRCITAAGAGRGEHRKFLGQFLRAAVRALGTLPITGTHKDFAVARALLAMKFVNRHKEKIAGGQKISSGKRRKISPFLSTANR